MNKQKPRKNQPPVKKQQAVKKTVPKPPDSKKANRYFVMAFFFIAFILYGNTILNKYAVDDEFVTNNEVVKQGLNAIPHFFKSYYVEQKGNVGTQVADYRPIVKVTYALEYEFLRGKPGRSHAINVFIYFLLSTSLFFVLKRLFKNYNILFPFLITIIFMAHPVHTEVVASLKNRDEMLAFLFAILGMHFFLKYADTRKIYNVFIGLGLFFIGYLSKSSIMPFLALYPLVFWFYTDLKPKKFLPVFIAVVAVGLLAHFLPRMFLPDATRLNSFTENPLYFDHNLWHRIGTGFAGLLFYLRILVYPYPLLYYYGFNMIPVTNLANIWVLLSIALYGGMFIYALMHIKEKTVLSFAILWFLIAISMYSNILVPVVGIVGERFVFVGSVGFAIALVYLIFMIFKTDPKSLTIEFDARAKILVILFLILVPYTALTISRNREWRNIFDLFRSDIPYLTNSAKANNQFAGYLMTTVYQDENFTQYGNINQFKKEKIKEHFRRSIELYPGNYQTLNDLGTVYLFFDKQPDSAIYYFRKAVAINEDLTPAWVNMGKAYREQGNYKEAITCYETILKKHPNEVRAIYALANVYNDMGDFNRAVQMNEDVLKQMPDEDVPYMNIGNYYMQRGDTITAVKNWEQAVARKPSYEGCMQLSYLYKMHGDMEKSQYYYQMAVDAYENSKQKQQRGGQ